MTTSSRTTRRALAVVLGAVAGVVVHTVAVATHGDILVPSGSSTAPVTVLQVVGAAVLAGLAGWAVLAAAEHWAPRLAARWTVLAGVVLVLSLAGPLGIAGIATADRVWLSLVHLAVAAGVVPLVRSTQRPVTADAEAGPVLTSTGV